MSRPDYDVVGDVFSSSYEPGLSRVDLEVFGSDGSAKRLRLGVKGLRQTLRAVMKADWSIPRIVDTTARDEDARQERDALVAQIARDFVRAHKVHGREADLYKRRVESQKAADVAVRAAAGDPERLAAARVEANEAAADSSCSWEVLASLLEMWAQKAGIVYNANLRMLVLAAIVAMDDQQIIVCRQHAKAVTGDYFLP